VTQVSADFETGTNGNALATSDVGSATPFDFVVIGGSSTLKYDNAHAAHGLLACQHANVAGAFNYYQWNIGGLVTHFSRGYFYFTANPSASRTLFHIRTSANANLAFVIVNTSGKLVLQDSVGAQTLTTNSIPLNQWFRVEAKFVHSATVGQIEGKLFSNPDSSTPTETATSAANLNTGTQGDRFGVGPQANSSGTDTFWSDNVIGGAAAYPGSAFLSGMIRRFGKGGAVVLDNNLLS